MNKKNKDHNFSMKERAEIREFPTADCEVCGELVDKENALYPMVQYGPYRGAHWLTCGSRRCFIKAVFGETNETPDAEIIKRMVGSILDDEEMKRAG